MHVIHDHDTFEIYGFFFVKLWNWSHRIGLLIVQMYTALIRIRWVFFYLFHKLHKKTLNSNIVLLVFISPFSAIIRLIIGLLIKIVILCRFFPHLIFRVLSFFPDHFSSSSFEHFQADSPECGHWNSPHSSKDSFRTNRKKSIKTTLHLFI